MAMTPYQMIEVSEIFNAYVEQDLLDDRREYTVADFEHSEGITHEQAVALYNKIQSETNPNFKPE